MKKALIHNEKVIELATAEFPVHESLEWVDVAETVEVGDDYKNGKATKPVVPAKSWRQKRREDYRDKGWNDATDLIDDILDRGMDAVKAERDIIKAAHPKT